MNKLYRCVSTILLLTLISCNSNSIGPILPQPQSYFEWAKTFVSNSQVYSGNSQIAIDSKGNSYVSGVFAGSTSFDSILIQNAPIMSHFIAKYNLKGNIVWVKWAPESEVRIKCLETDREDNLIITGTFNSGTRLFSNDGLINKATLVKINGDGNFIWSTFTTDFAAFHKPDNSGNTLQISNQGGIVLKLFKISSQGDIILSKDLAVSATLSVTNMSITDNSFFLTGAFSGKVIFGNVTMNVVDVGGCYYLAKFDLDGNCLWAVNSDSHSSGNKIAFDKLNDRILVYGYFDDGKIKIENIVLGTGVDRSMFVASYSSNSKLIWAKDLKAGPSTVGGLDVDQIGNIYLANGFYNKLDFGGVYLESSTGEIFVAKLDSNFNLLWSEKTSNSLAAFPWDMNIDNEGNAYLTGSFQQSIYFGNSLLSGNGFFIAKCLNH